MFKKVLPVFIFTFIFISSITAGNFSEKNVLYVKPSVVFVYSPIQAQITFNKKDGTKANFPPISIESFGSGFIVNPDGYVVTNGHVVMEYYNKDNTKLKQQIVASIILKNFIPQLENQKGAPLTQEEKIQVFNQLFPKFNVILKKDLYVILSNGESFPAEVKQYSPPMTGMPGKIDTGGLVKSEEMETGKDVAVLKIEKNNLPSIKLGNSDNVHLQDPIYVIGYPGAVVTSAFLSKKTTLEASITSGHVSSLKLDIKGTPVIQFDAAIGHGNSGGPVINEKGEVIGVATFGSLSQNRQTLVQGFNFAIPVNTVKEFINAAGVRNEIGIFNKLWYQILNEFYSEPSHSSYDDVIRKCDELLRILPKQPDVVKIQIKAQKWIMDHPETFLSKYGLIILIAIILLIVIILIVVLTTGKKKKIPPAEDLKKTIVDVDAATKTVTSFGKIVCEEGPLAGKSFTITKSGLKLGRDGSLSNVVIPNEHISKLHAEIIPTTDGVVVVDKNSTNGTYINEVTPESIKTYKLKDGDKIILGRKAASIFTYHSK